MNKEKSDLMTKKLIALLLTLVLFMNSAVAIDADSLLVQAEEYCQAGDMKRALACVELAERVAPQDAKIDMTAADIYLKMNDTQSALQRVDNALKKDPLSSQGWMLRCRCDLRPRRFLGR